MSRAARSAVERLAGHVHWLDGWPVTVGLMVIAMMGAIAMML
jgi:hypothetical protein